VSSINASDFSENWLWRWGHEETAQSEVSKAFENEERVKKEEME